MTQSNGVCTRMQSGRARRGVVGAVRQLLARLLGRQPAAHSTVVAPRLGPTATGPAAEGDGVERLMHHMVVPAIAQRFDEDVVECCGCGAAVPPVRGLGLCDLGSGKPVCRRCAVSMGGEELVESLVLLPMLTAQWSRLGGGRDQ